MNSLKRWWLGLAILLVIAPVLMMQVSAQDGNLLQDPGFEGPYVGRGRPTLNTSAPWQLWLQDGPHNYDWQNRADKVFAFPHNTAPEIHSGAHSQNINGGYVTFTAAIYQQVSVTPGANLTGSIWGRLHTCDLPKNSGICGSAVESGAYIKVGLDPNGGTDPNSPSIVWSGNIMPHDSWQQATVSATAAAGTMTMFAYVTQMWPSDLNNVWFDDAVLTGGGAGGSAPGQPAAVPTARPVATAFVAIVQPPRPDGSIVHTVQIGDTLTGISSAYGVSVDTIMKLNNLISSRYIYVGEGLLIKPAGGSSGASSTQDVSSGTGTTASTGDLLSASDLASLNTTPGPTPVGMQLGPTPTPTLQG